MKAMEWIQENISKPVQWGIMIILVIGFLGSLPQIIRSCNSTINYETVNANFIEEEVALHGDNYTIQVLEANTVDHITIKDKNDTSTELSGHYIAITFRVKQNSGSKKNHKLDANDFKLKDHTGTMVPTSKILSLIDVDAPDIRSDKGDSIDSQSTFSTRRSIKDYGWIGMELVPNKEHILTVYFKMDMDKNVENTIMIFEADFMTGSGETRSATDIVLFRRKAPIE